MATIEKVPSVAKDCYICQKPYDDPKLLPCIHAFCKCCLEDSATKTNKHAGDTMACPLCGKSFSIPVKGFDALQTDFFLRRLNERLKARSLDGADFSPGVLEARDCDLHSQAKLTIYCTDCERVVCEFCFQESHQNHRLQGTKQAAATFCNEFQHCCFSGGKTETLERVEEFKRDKLQLGKAASCLRKNVRVRQESIEELLDKHAQSMLRDIESEEVRLLDKYESMSKHHEQHLACVQSFEDYCREITTKGSPDDICFAMTNIKRRSNELVEMHGSLRRLVSPQYLPEFKESDLEEFFSNDDWNIIGSITGFGRRRPTKVSRKEQIDRLNERIDELKNLLKQTNRENRDLQAVVERLMRELEDLQSSIEVHENSEAREEIESLQRQLEQMTVIQQSTERQMEVERIHFNGRIEELDAERTRNHIEIGHQSREMLSLKSLLGYNPRERRRYEIDKAFSGQIMNKMSSTVDIRVTGLAILNGELFMTTCNSNVLEVRDLTNIKTLRRKVKVEGLDDPYDICSCPKEQRLYIFDKESWKICSIDKAGNPISVWTTGDDVGTLSVADDSNVILILHEANKLKEYYPYGSFIKEIELFKYGIDSPWHAVKLTPRYYVISHGDHLQRLQRVCIADVVEGATIRSFGEDLDCPMSREITPFYMTCDAAGYVMVADRKSNSVLLLKPTLEFDKAVVENGDFCSRPDADLLAERFCLDEASCLIVASNFKNNGRWACSVRFIRFK